jgi:outer membrane protein assembly factor BamE
MQITTMAARTAAWLALCALATAGCVYQMPIQQGNYPDAASLAQVRPGMTRAQVRYLLGTPQVPGAFDNERWDYDYYLKVSHTAKPRRARATVFFRNDLVDRVDSDVKPAPASAETPVPVPAAAAAPAAAT